MLITLCMWSLLCTKHCFPKHSLRMQNTLASKILTSVNVALYRVLHVHSVTAHVLQFLHQWQLLAYRCGNFCCIFLLSINGICAASVMCHVMWVSKPFIEVYDSDMVLLPTFHLVPRGHQIILHGI